MPLHVSTGKQGIIWDGSFFVHHSLALVNRELVLALFQREQFEVGIRNFEPPTFDPKDEPRFGPLAARLSAHPAKPAVTVRHRWPADFTRPESGKLVMIQPWEFGSLPRLWVDGIAANVDEVWVPTHFVREEYMSSGVPGDKVVVVPNGVNTDRFRPGIAPLPLPTRKRFKFLFVGGTIARKGIDVLLDAYTREFKDTDDVTLVIKDFGAGSFYAGQGAESLIAAFQAKPGAPEILHLTDDLTEDGVASLYSACDALAHPYRGEGYGLPIAEAMACGKPTIVTGFGASLDFASPANSILIPAAKTYFDQTHIGDLELVGRPWWAEPDREALAGQMRRLYENPAEGHQIGARAAADIAASHTWAHAAEIAANRIELLTVRRTPSFERPSVSEAATESTKQEALGLARAGNWMQAIEVIEAARANPPVNASTIEDWDLLNTLGVAYHRTGRSDMAIKILSDGVNRAPVTRDFHHNLAFVLLACDNPEDALFHAVAAAEASPEVPEIRRTLERARQAAKAESRRIRKKLARSGASKEVKRNPEILRLAQMIERADALLDQRAEVPSPIVDEPTTVESPRLSVVMIVKDEEAFLRGCLESVRGAADEIIIVDTGSRDRTLDIAAEFGATIVSHSWTDDFSEARNVSLDHATGDWALWLDADERLAEGGADLLRYLILEAQTNVGGYMINIRNVMTAGDNPEVCWHRACRLFRNQPSIRFTGRIHEQNMRALQESGYVCALSQLNIDHLGYTAEVMDARNKHERFIRMLTREVEENHDPAYRTFHLFNLGNAYFTRGDMNSAAGWFEKAADTADPGEEYTAIMFVEWATALYATSRSSEALRVCDQAEKLGIRHPGLEFARGHAFLHLMRYSESEARFKSALEMGRGGHFVQTGDTGTYTYKAWYGLALAVTGQNRYEDAVSHCEKALAESPAFIDAIFLLSKALTRVGRASESRKNLERLLALEPGYAAARLDLGLVLGQLGDHGEAIRHLRRFVETEPGVFEGWAQLGDSCLHAGLADEAREAYVTARRLSPRSPEICVNLGRAHTVLGAYDAAIDAFTDAMFIDPTYANAYFNAGDLLYKLGYYPKAADVLCSGLKLDPENASGFLVLGNCYFHTNNLESARLAFRAAIVRNPDLAEAINNLEVVDEALRATAIAA